jgi:hypothetical protein
MWCVDVMARDRSPNYPAISLPVAIERVKSWYSTVHMLNVPRNQAAKMMGYSSENGAALSAISAELKYGLLVKMDNGYQITNRATSLLLPNDDREKAQAIWDAASSPAVFVELMDTFPGIIPEDSDIAGYLLRRGFGDIASRSVSRAFRETFALVLSEAFGYSPPVENATGRSPRKRITASSGSAIEIAPPLVEKEKMRVTVTEAGVEVSAALTSSKGVDRLIRALEATKPLICGTVSSDIQKAAFPKGEPGSGQPRPAVTNLKSGEAVKAARKVGGT